MDEFDRYIQAAVAEIERRKKPVSEVNKHAQAAHDLIRQADLDAQYMTTPTRADVSENPKWFQGSVGAGIANAYSMVGNVLSMPEQAERLGVPSGVIEASRMIGGAMTGGTWLSDKLTGLRQWAAEGAYKRSRELQQFAANNPTEGLAQGVLGAIGAAPGTVAAYLPFAMGGGATSLIGGMAIGEVGVNLDRMKTAWEIPKYAARGIVEGLIFNRMATLENLGVGTAGAVAGGTLTSLGFTETDFNNINWEQHLTQGITMGIMQRSLPALNKGLSTAQDKLRQGVGRAAVQYRNKVLESQATRLFREVTDGVNNILAKNDEDLRTIDRQLDETEAKLGLPKDTRIWMQSQERLAERAQAAALGRHPQRVVQEFSDLIESAPALGRGTISGFAKWRAENASLIREFYELADGRVPPLNEILAKKAKARDIAEFSKILNQPLESPRYMIESAMAKRQIPPRPEQSMLVEVWDGLLQQRQSLLDKGARTTGISKEMLSVQDAWTTSMEFAKQHGLDAYYVFAEHYPHLQTRRFQLDFTQGLNEVLEGHSYSFMDMPALRPDIQLARQLSSIDKITAKLTEDYQKAKSDKQRKEIKAQVEEVQRRRGLVEQRAAAHMKEPSLFDSVFEVLETPSKHDPLVPATKPLFKDLSPNPWNNMMRNLITGRGLAKLSDNPMLHWGVEKVNSTLKRVDLQAQELMYAIRQRTEDARTDRGKTAAFAAQRDATEAGGLTEFSRANADEAAAVLRFAFEEDWRGQLAGRTDQPVGGVIDGQYGKDTAERARLAGLTDKQYRMYTSMRSMMDKTIKMYYDTVRVENPNLPEITPFQMLYMVRQHKNAWRKVFVERYAKGADQSTPGTNVFVHPASNHITYKRDLGRIQEQIRQMNADDPNFTYKVVEGPVQKVVRGGLPEKWVTAAMRELEKAGNDRVAAQLHKVLVQEATLDVHGIGRVDQRVGGYLGDPNTSTYGIKKSNEALVKEFEEAAHSYVYGMLNIIERHKLDKQFAALKDPNLPFQEHYPTMVEYLEAYKKNAFGHISEGTAWTRNLFGKVTGNPLYGEMALQHLNTFTLRTALGNFRFVMSMPYQTFQMGLPKLQEAKYVHGHKGSVTEAVGKALSEFMTPGKESKEIIALAVRDGVLDPNFVKDFNSGLDAIVTRDSSGQHAVPQKGAIENFRNKSLKQQAAIVGDKLYRATHLVPLIERVEAATRTHNLLQNYYFMRSAGYTKQRAYREALAMTNDVMVDYIRSEKLPLYQEHFASGNENPANYFMITKAMSPFKTFTGNWWGHLAAYTKQAGLAAMAKKNPMAAAPLLTFIGTNLLAGGMVGMVGLSLYDFVAKQMGWTTSEMFFSQVDDNGEAIFNPILTHGAPSTIYGVDITGTLGMPGLDPQFDYISMPAGRKLKGIADAGWESLKWAMNAGDPKDLALAWKKVINKQYHGAIDLAYMKKMFDNPQAELLALPTNKVYNYLLDAPVPIRSSTEYDPHKRTLADWYKYFVTGARSMEETRSIQRAIAFAQERRNAAQERADIVDTLSLYMLHNRGELPGWLSQLPVSEQKSLVTSAVDQTYKRVLSDRERIFQGITSPGPEADTYQKFYGTQ